MTEALLLWEERELLRSAFLASFDDAKASIAHGEGIPIAQASMRSLADDVNPRGRERLASGGSVGLMAHRLSPQASSTEQRGSSNAISQQE